MAYLAMSVYINKETSCSPNSQGPPTLNDLTFILQYCRQQRNTVTYTEWHRVRAITRTTSLDRLRIVFSSTRQSYKRHVQPRVEPNSHNTFPRVKLSGSEILGQVYDYRTSQEGAVSGQELDHGREGTLYGPSGKCPRNLPRPVRFESPHTPRHPRATDRRDREIRKTRQLHGE